MQIILLTILAMIAFAANSVLCRVALGNQLIDASSFTAVRLASGALMLLILLYLRQPDNITRFSTKNLNLASSFALFTYAICFSFAYVNMSTGTGALILFGTVQMTMILFGVVKGEKTGLLVWTGITFAFGGLVYLVSPGIHAPPVLSAILMATAGLAWGIYSLRGKNSRNPVADTTWNFTGTIVFVIPTCLLFIGSMNGSVKGIILAIASGALASGVGYVIWYAALPGLSWTAAAVVQLSVPTIAALGGVVFMTEPLTLRLSYATIATLGGITLVIYAKRPARTAK